MTQMTQMNADIFVKRNNVKSCIIMSSHEIRFSKNKIFVHLRNLRILLLSIPTLIQIWIRRLLDFPQDKRGVAEVVVEFQGGIEFVPEIENVA